MVRYSIIILFLINCFISFSQNLIPNYSFENTISCPQAANSITNNCFNWYSPSAASPDLYHSCAPLPFGPNVPNSMKGYQVAKTGNAYAGLGTFSSNNGREYIAAKLNDSLIANEYYCFSINLSLPNNTLFASNKIGAYFSRDSIYTPILTELLFTPQIEFTQMITDTTNWVLLEADYQANGGGKFITIGNFRNNLNTDSFNVTGLPSNALAYYFVDDISLTLCKTSDSLHLSLPNVFTPNSDGENDNFVIEVLGAKNLKKLSAKVYNRWGMLVNSVEFPVLSDEHTQYSTLHTQYTLWDGYTTAAAQAPQGTYYYTVTYTTIDDETFTEKSYLTLFR